MYCLHICRTEDLETYDITQHFDEFYDIVSKIKENKQRCLVHCTTGKSISPALIMSYMMKSAKAQDKILSLKKSFDYIDSRYIGINPNDTFMSDLISLEESLFEQTSLRIKSQGRGSSKPTYARGKGKRGKSWLYGTKLIMYDGSVKCVEELVVGDILVGDDSTPRIITTVDHSVSDDVYSIQSKIEGGPSFCCTSSHVLVLQCTWNTFTSARRGSVEVRQYKQPAVLAPPIARIIRKFSTKQSADDFISSLPSPPIVYEMSVGEYDKLSSASQIRHVSSLIRVPSILSYGTNSSLRDCIESITSYTGNELDHATNMTAWILGTYLGDGRTDQGKILQVNSIHQQVMDRIESWGNIMHTRCNKQLIQLSSSDNPYYEFTFENNILLRILQHYGMHDRKTISQQLLRDTLAVRQHLFAGYIDAGGKYDQSERRLEANCKQKPLLELVQHLARSIGLRTGPIYYRQNIYCADTNAYYDGYETYFCGAAMLDLAPMLACQNKATTTSDVSTSEHQHAHECCKFNITKLQGNHQIVSIKVSVNTNQRVVHDDFTVASCK